MSYAAEAFLAICHHIAIGAVPPHQATQAVEARYKLAQTLIAGTYRCTEKVIA